VGNDFSAGDGVFKGIMMLEGKPEMLGYRIQLMTIQVRQKVGRYGAESDLGRTRRNRQPEGGNLPEEDNETGNH